MAVNYRYISADSHLVRWGISMMFQDGKERVIIPPKHQIQYPEENLNLLDSSFLRKWSISVKKEKELPYACFG